MKVRIQAPKRDLFGQDIFDYLIAEFQWQHDYELTPDVAYGEPSADAFNILFISMPESQDWPVLDFDLVVLDNADEAFGRGTEAIYHMLDKHSNCVLACNSVLHPQHAAHAGIGTRIVNTMISWNYHRRYYIEPMYACSLEFAMPTPVTGSMIYINGRNRSWREHIRRMLIQHVPRLTQHNEIQNNVTSDTKFCWHEDEYDTAFRIQCNDLYTNRKHNDHPPEQRWPQLPAGINGRFGHIHFYDRFFSSFRNHAVIVYPESTWQNNILSFTEKSLKCFMHGRWAMPFGGANLHALFESSGFHTARCLLPESLQQFDSILDHDQRYQAQCQALNWLLDNPDVFHSDHAQRVLVDNQARTVVISSVAGRTLLKIIHEKTRH
jgi:hypothetical protein